jgi:hypothetical protein
MMSFPRGGILNGVFVRSKPLDMRSHNPTINAEVTVPYDQTIGRLMGARFCTSNWRTLH